MDACLKIQYEKILSLSFANQEKTEGEVIDGHGHLLLPGLIDPQVHFRETGGEHKETLETGETPADELIRRFKTDWAGDVTKVFGEYSY